MHNRFAVIKLWENTLSAEDENIARLINASKEIGIECIPIDRNYRFISDRTKIANEEEFDFVIHLHFDSVKLNNLFSFVALWNPLSFYHEWGYRKFSDALLTHDDFLSCASVGADRHIKRLIYNDPYHLHPQFTLFHSLSSPIYDANKRTDKKLFYCGINWERLGKKIGRHTELLKYFDDKNLIDIYGPKLLEGIKVWKGYKGYKGEVPFDGVTIINKINKSGIALVLSSNAHIKSELMSNRLFESLAAGANIICDQNKFAKKYFGDLFYYIDTSASISEQCQKIDKYISEINTFPDIAYERVKKAQKIFLEKFELKKSLRELYDNFLERKSKLHDLYSKEIKTHIKICHICDNNIDDIINNINNNKNISIEHIIYGNKEQLKQISINVDNNASRFEEVEKNETKAQIIEKFITLVRREEFFSIVFPGETLLSDHYIKLAVILESSNNDCVYSQILICSQDSESIHTTSNIDSPNEIRSFANFLFSGEILTKGIKYILPDLTSMFAHLFYISSKNKRSIKSYTCILKKISTQENNIIDINIINDIYPFVMNECIYKKNRRRYFLGFIKKHLQFLKKYPQIWKLLRNIQQYIE